jgi:Fibronectin type III-like domain
MAQQRDNKMEASAAATTMQRAEDLPLKMTIEEKAMQLSCLYPMSLLGTEGPIQNQLDLEPGASKNVSFVIPMSLLGYTGISGNFVIEPGPVEVSVGSSSNGIRSTAKFTITGKTRTISGEDRMFLSVTNIG